MGGGLLGLALGCVNIGFFGCERDSQCELSGLVGRCVDPGYCALPDDSCESGYRYHEGSVPEDLAGRCAPAEPEPPGSSSGNESTSGSSSGGDSTTTGSSSSTDGGSSTTGNPSCGDHPCGCTASLAVGTNHTCAARFDGRVMCWGINGNGELGMGTDSNPIPWPQQAPLPGVLMATTLHDGNNHTCALMSNDAVLCWGRNAGGEIDPQLRDDILGPTQLPLAESPGVIALAPQHTCVASPTGPEVRCLGNNTNGELGGPNPDPVDGAIPAMQAIGQMSLGRDHSCAESGGQVWCWGRNNYGQLGEPMVMDMSETPVEVVLPGAATVLGGGRDHTCAALDGSGEVVCWGRNHVGQIGDGTNVRANTPTPLVAPLPAPVVSMTGRLDTTCALLDDGDVWCWGGLYGVELGTTIEPEMELVEPMRIEVIDELPEPVVEVAVGTNHMCARADSGRLWCWGSDDNEQLGPIDPPVGMRAVELDVECPPGVGN